MAGKRALVDPEKCDPQRCGGGWCGAVEACSHKLIKQEERGDFPMFHPSVCQGCSDCVRACPLKAVKIYDA